MNNLIKPGVILVPLDFSEQSTIALEQAVSLSKAFHSEVHVLSVLEDDFSSEQALLTESDSEEILTKLRSKLEEYAKEKEAALRCSADHACGDGFHI
jgi:nucleotide-binding universal stress UspA family protein